MKKIFSFVAAALMSASMFATPAAIPTIQDVAGAGFDVTSARVIVLYFDELVCNDIVWAGSYNEWNTTPEDMAKFEPLENFPGWYVCEVLDARTPQEDQTIKTNENCCVGKPVQLKKDGSFNWDFQTGDADAWINMVQPGTKTHYIYGGYSGEADICWNEYGAYIYEVAYFKNHNTPCGQEKPKHDYTFTLYLPTFCDEIADYADSVYMMGNFAPDGWEKGLAMEKKVDDDFNDYWYAELKNMEEGTEFKFRCGTMNWDIQVQKDGKDLENMKMEATTDTVLHFDGEGYGFKACAAPAEYKYTEYENWQIKYGPDWTWSDNMTKGENATFTLDIIWGGTGINVQSDENPIKQDWYATDDPYMTIAEGVAEGDKVTVTLTVVDDETLTLNVAKSSTTGTEDIEAALDADGTYIINGQMYIRNNGKLINVLGF